MVKIKHYKLIWDDHAFAQLEWYLEQVSNQSKSAPKIIVTRIMNRLKGIQKSPYICAPDRFKYNNNGIYRAFTVYSYRVTYSIKENQINIIRVRHTSEEPLEY